MEDKEVSISIDKYDLQENWINKIASKYIDVDNINYLKVGLFGYINEVLATTNRYAVAHRNFLYDEAFLNTASLTNSIYNKAKSYNYEIPLATPATCNVTFTIQESSIISYGKKEINDITGAYNGNYTFTISKNDQFFIDNYEFHLEDDVIIKATKLSSNKYAYTAQYNRIKNKGIFSKSSNPYITVWTSNDTVTNEVLITLQLEIYQYSIKNVTYENYSSDLSDNLTFETKYENDLCHFYMTYETNSTINNVNLYFNDTFTPNDDYFGYYYFNNNVLITYFSGLPDCFKPNINSKLHLYIYTTLGKLGNISYDGTILFQFSSSRTAKIPVSISKLTDAAGGSNILSKSEIKSKLITEFLTRDNLITEFDLNTFFNNVIKSEVINNSKILFIKKRDDMFKRTFAGFLLLRDKSGLIIPSNTIDLNIKPIIDVNEEFHVNCGAIVIYSEYVELNDEFLKYFNNYNALLDEKISYDKVFTFNKKQYVRYKKYYDSFRDKLTFLENGTDSYILTNSDDIIYFNKNDNRPEFQSITNEDDYKLVYRLPYALHYKKSPFPRLLAIRDNFNTQLYFNYKYVNSNIAAEFIINSLNISRTSITYDRLESDDLIYDKDGNLDKRITVINNGYRTKTYIVEYDELGDVKTSNIKNPETTITNDINKYFLSFTLNTTLDDIYFGNTNNVICRCLLKNSEIYTGYFDFELSLNDSITYTKELVTDNYLDDNNRLRLIKSIYDINTGELLDEFYLDEKLTIEIALLTKVLNPNSEPPIILTEPLLSMNDIEGYTQAVRFESNKEFSFFLIMNDVIAPTMVYNQENHLLDSEKGIIVKQLPVVGKHYLYNYGVFQDFFQMFEIFYDILTNNFNRLESNTSINLKFYNTYGHSHHFTSDSTNIKLKLTIKLADSYSQDLDFNIKNYIIDFIEKINDSNTKVFAISNLIRNLEKTFPDIQYIEFDSINDKNKQIISYDYPSISDMTKTQLINYIPEFLNIQINSNAYISGKDNFDVNIEIEYK